jgi:hypothetical protein
MFGLADIHNVATHDLAAAVKHAALHVNVAGHLIGVLAGIRVCAAASTVNFVLPENVSLSESCILKEDCLWVGIDRRNKCFRGRICSLADDLGGFSAENGLSFALHFYLVNYRHLY